MAARIEIEGKFYRNRRGKLVKIPAEWLGKIPTEQTYRLRESMRKCKKLARRKRVARKTQH